MNGLHVAIIKDFYLHIEKLITHALVEHCSFTIPPPIELAMNELKKTAAKVLYLERHLPDTFQALCSSSMRPNKYKTTLQIIHQSKYYKQWKYLWQNKFQFIAHWLLIFSTYSYQTHTLSLKSTRSNGALSQNEVQLRCMHFWFWNFRHPSPPRSLVIFDASLANERFIQGPFLNSNLQRRISRKQEALERAYHAKLPGLFGAFVSRWILRTQRGLGGRALMGLHRKRRKCSSLPAHRIIHQSVRKLIESPNFREPAWEKGCARTKGMNNKNSIIRP